MDIASPPAERCFAKTDDLAAQLASLARDVRTDSLVVPPPLPAGAPSAISRELVPTGVPGPPARYHVQTDIGLGSDAGAGKIKVLDEEQLARHIRSGKLTGIELVRRDDEERWQPLFESRVFRREVPTAGDPREAARWRVLRAVGGHLGVFAMVSAGVYFTQGQLRFWLGIWGAVLGIQTLRAAPTLLSVLRRPRPQVESPATVPTLSDPTQQQLALPGDAAAVPSPVAQEAARIRALIAERGGSDASALLAEVDRIVALTADLAARWAGRRA